MSEAGRDEKALKANNVLKERKPYSIKHLVNWYFGNYCVKKCYGVEKIQKDHWEKLQDFAAKNPDLLMTHREFIEFFAKDMAICKFDYQERKRMPTWKEVSLPECEICKKLKVPRW